MEKKGVTLSVAIVGYLVLGLLLGQCSAVENPECYAGCLNKCKSSRGMMLLACGSACALQCLFSSPSLLSVPKDNHYFCKLGCSASLCNNFLDAENPEITEKVGGCMDSCSDRCATMNTMNLPPNNN